MIRKLALAAAFLLASALAALALVTLQVWRDARTHEARPADVIVVLGAAEYNGRPSPVFRARLDHGLALYQRGLARYIVTTGGRGGDPVFTEGEVGRSYLIRRGVPTEAIIVESEASTTVQSVTAIAEMLRRMEMHSCIVVTDGYHMFRTKRMFRQLGFAAYGSPRPSEVRVGARFFWLCTRQAAAYLGWMFGVAV